MEKKLLLSVTRALASSLKPVVRVASGSICASDAGARPVVVRRAEALHVTEEGVELPSLWEEGVWGRDEALAISTAYTGNPADFFDVSAARYAAALLGSAFAIDYQRHVGDSVSDGRYGLFAETDWSGDGADGDLTVKRVGYCSSGFAWSDFLSRAAAWHGGGGNYRALYVTGEMILGDALRRVVISCDYASPISWLRRGAIWSAASGSAGTWIGRWEHDIKGDWWELPCGALTSFRLQDRVSFDLSSDVAAAPVHFV